MRLRRFLFHCVHVLSTLGPFGVSPHAGTQIFPRSLARPHARSARPFAHRERLKFWDGIFGLLLYGSKLRLELDDMRMKRLVVLSQRIIFLLEALAHGMEGNIALDFALLEELNAGLQLGELHLLAFAECTLCGTVWLTICHQSRGIALRG